MNPEPGTRNLVIAAMVALAAAVPLAQRPSQAPARAGQTLPRFTVLEKTIPELQAAMQARTVTSRDLVTLYLARIKLYDQDGPKLDAMIALNPKALDEAAALDAERRAGRVRGPLHGIPIVVKDNYVTED